MDRRFVAFLEEAGNIRLPADGAELRLVASNEVSGHARPFLPDSDYQPVDVQVLRKVDGTGFFLLPSPTDSEFGEGQYRLQLTYQRNNLAVDPESQVFSEAGNTAPECVKIDIPFADVLITIEYTALVHFDYRQQVTQQ